MNEVKLLKRLTVCKWIIAALAICVIALGFLCAAQRRDISVLLATETEMRQAMEESYSRARQTAEFLERELAEED